MMKRKTRIGIKLA